MSNHEESDMEALPTKEVPPSPEVPAVFLDERADLWIKSSDGALFKVHKLFLVSASAFWNDLFATSAASSEGSTPASAIPCDEPATVITGLLYEIYPITKPRIDTVEYGISLLLAADKWLMDRTTGELMALLSAPRFLDARPMAIYSATCHVPGLEKLKYAAARRLVELYDPLDPSLRPDTAGWLAQDLLALIDLRKDRVTYCLKEFKRALPEVCPYVHQEVIYGSWHQQLRNALSRDPSAACVSLPPWIVENFSADCLNGNNCPCVKISQKISVLRQSLSNDDSSQ